MPVSVRVAERRSERLIEELLTAQAWDLRRPPQGDVLAQHEYKDYQPLREALKASGKAGAGGAGIPEFIVADRTTGDPLMVIEAKARAADIGTAYRDVVQYGTAFIEAGFAPLAVAIAGTEDEKFAIRVLKWIGSKWQDITYESQPIAWIPNREHIERLRRSKALELRPSIPPLEVLHTRADEINGLLRESGLKDDFRPAAIGAIMLALWKSGGAIRRDQRFILADINQACSQAFWDAEKPDLAKSLRVDEANDKLAVRARRICEILERLNITTLTAEHDYLGALYEEFFRYTGGNTIGQYFTPRHITRLMADLGEIGRDDVVLDPACGTGGFLIAAMGRMQRVSKLPREQVIKVVRKQLIGLENEPVTAALCIANMILRGDGSTGVVRADCFNDAKFPFAKADVVLMNPPFPHAKTDTPPDVFVSRALEGLKKRGTGAIIVPSSLLSKREKAAWRTKMLAHNGLRAVISLPSELFQPYASSTTAILLFEKGVPHARDHRTFFCRVENDGFRLKKGVRVPQPGSQVDAVVSEYRRRGNVPGFCAAATLEELDQWHPGAYIEARPLTSEELHQEIAALIRSKAAFVVQHAPQIAATLDAVRTGELQPTAYGKTTKQQELLPARKARNSKKNVRDYFTIHYGQKELHSKEHLGPGKALIISSSGADNGCYGFFDFPRVIKPPFVTVPSTGSIGEACVQEFPCGVTDDCLLLMPRPGTPQETLYIVAAVLRRERWRFDYGRKMTPNRIADFPLPVEESVPKKVRELLNAAERIEDVALADAAEAQESEAARAVLADPQGKGRLVTGDELRSRLDRCLT